MPDLKGLPVHHPFLNFWSFEIGEGILRNQKIIIGLDSFSNQRSIYLAPFGIILVSRLHFANFFQIFQNLLTVHLSDTGDLFDSF